MDAIRLAQLQKLSQLMDRAFTIPGTRIPVGLDPILGLIPGIGDTLALAVSLYIYAHARDAGVPWRKRMLMLWNLFVDWLIGLFPLVGDIFDVGFRANTRNVAIITAYSGHSTHEQEGA